MCPDHAFLSAFLDGELEQPWKAAVEEHCESCPSCRLALSRMAETRRLLTAELPSDWHAPMERVRARIMAHSVRLPILVPVWRRRLSVPVPMAAAAMFVVAVLAVALFFSLTHPNVGMVRITKAPAGGTEIQIAAPLGDLEGLLKNIGNQDTNPDVMQLPKQLRLVPVGEPFMGRETEFSRK